jgi:glycosyltransferase involved in cell wall biosynthesis
LSECTGGARSVLAITSEVPWPLDTGGHQRTFHVLRSLSENFRLRLVAPAEPGQSEAVAELARRGIDVIPVPVAPRTLWSEVPRVLKASALGEPYVFYRRHDRRAVRSAIHVAISQHAPDLFYLDHLDSFLYRPALPDVPAVIDLHNVYSTLAQRAAREGRSRGKALYLGREAELLVRVEHRIARGPDVLLAVSEEDRRHFSSLGGRRVALVPNGVDCDALADMPTGRESGPPLVLFVGSLSWGPNVSAARILAREIMPAVRRRCPEARARIVGRGPSPDVLALGRLPGIEVLGSVPDVGPHLREASLLAVPLHAGGGTRLKILEAFAAGLPVVSTPIGCEGIDAVDGTHLHVAELDRFAEVLAGLLDDPERGTRLAGRARILARDHYDWGIIGARATSAVEAAMSRGDDPAMRAELQPWA